MPRITYADRFDALLAKDYLSDRDRIFAESLYTSYRSRKVLTAGRKRCLLNLEVSYEQPPETDEETLARLTDLRARMTGPDSKWAMGFTESLLNQAKSGSALSSRQQEVLTNIEAKWTDDELTRRASWKQTFTPEMFSRFKVMVEYYGKNGYFQNVVKRHHANPEEVPTKGDYDRLTANKYAEKVLAGYFDPPKYPVGSMVSLRSSAGWGLGQKMRRGLSVIIEQNAQVPVAAARGNKVYKVLPVGGTQTIFAEERALKVHRQRPTKK
jgi:hypothetical protein